MEVLWGSLIPKTKNRDFLGGSPIPKSKNREFFGGSPIPKSKIDQKVNFLATLVALHLTPVSKSVGVS